MNGQYAYYHICTSNNLTQTVSGVTTRQIIVDCQLAELGELPAEAMGFPKGLEKKGLL